VTDTTPKPPLDFPELESEGGGAPADEFANVPSPRRRHPLIALGASVLAFFLIYQIHDDLFFALSHSTARDVGDARALAALPQDKLPVNEYVKMSGTADRESGVIIDTAGSWKFTQFFRLLGTRSRVFVSRVPDPIPVEQAERDVFVGRLVRFKDLSFQDAIRKHFASRVGATHFFVPGAVRDALAGAGGGSITLTDMLGEKVSLAANDELSVDVARPADVEVLMPKARFADMQAARAAVEQQGASVLDEAMEQAADGKTVALAVTLPEEKRDQVMNAISDLDGRIRFRPMRTVHSVRMADLGAGKSSLILQSSGKTKEIDLSQILAIRTLANVQIPGDAVLLREGERPRDHIKSIVVAAFLLGFAIINLVALRTRG